MKKLIAIARLTALEALRSKILVIPALFAAGILLGSQFVDYLSLGEQAKIFKDLALGLLSVFVCLLGLALPVELMLRERQRNSLAVMLCKPVPRALYLGGKLLGVLMVLMGVAGALTALIAFLAQTRGAAWDDNILKAAALILCQGFLLASLSLGMGLLFTSHFLSLACGAAIYMAGHMLEPLVQWAERAQGVFLKSSALLLLYGLPHLQNLNMQDSVALGEKVAWAYVGGNVLYTLAYCAVVFALSAMFFQREDL